LKSLGSYSTAVYSIIILETCWSVALRLSTVANALFDTHSLLHLGPLFAVGRTLSCVLEWGSF